ncbi:MAG: beta-hexosaminidase [Caulobacter sp. 39-67-4]|nr:MAG: beta-hexosaminidase [Caulobacter sp. 39-67-4]
MILVRSVAALASAIALVAAVPALADPVALTPMPAKLSTAEGVFPLTAKTRIFVAKGDIEARGVAAQLSDLLFRARGLKPVVVEGAPSAGEAAIVLARGGATGEGYALQSGPSGVTITAAKRAGLFYGAMTLWQLATQEAGKGPADLPSVAIEDAPRFGWRGLMIDSARHVQSVETLRGIIDAMAVQGWRLEIKKYPKLTEVGAWRTPAGAAGRDPKTGKAIRYGGFYTQDEVRELVAYAAARNVTIVPEIEMPGHALAPIVAYPHLGVNPNPPAIDRNNWGIFPWLYNLDDSTFAFLNDVLDEVMDLFPSDYIHVGGDEAVKDQWKASPKIQAQIKALALKDEHEAQSYFIQRIGKHLDKRGRRLIGWDEILEGGLAPNATVMSWRGLEGAIAAAKLGHDTVLSPWPLMYLDNRQSASPDEPPGRGRVVSLKDVYDFDPAPKEMTEVERKHVIGLQGNAWTEHMRTDVRLERMIFPRLVAVAERGWSPQTTTDWADFNRRMPAEFARLDALGVAYDAVHFEPQAKLSPGEGGKVDVALASSLAIGEIRYTVGGAEPTTGSNLYEKPLALAANDKLRARTFVDGRPLGRVRDLSVNPDSLLTRTGHQLKACSDKLTLLLEDDAPVQGDRAVFHVDIMNPCWIWEGADLAKGATLTARIGQAPFNFQIGADREKIPLRAPATPEGELEVLLGCEGERIAAIPLGKAVREPALSTISGKIPARPGKHDLCLMFTSKSVDPTFAIDRVTLKSN